MYKLKSEDLSTLGSMGSTTRTNFIKYFETVEEAKEYAQNDYDSHNSKYRRKAQKIKWKHRLDPPRDIDNYCSGDMGFVMYDIDLLTIEDSTKVQRKKKLKKILLVQLDDMLKNVDEHSKEDFINILKDIKNELK